MLTNSLIELVGPINVINLVSLVEPLCFADRFAECFAGYIPSLALLLRD